MTASVPTNTEQFLWGATLSAHAVEGQDFDSDWWRWEQRPKRIAGGGTSEVASGHLERYRDDIRLAGKAGLNCLQYGLSWARISPAPGVVDAQALEHYASGFRTMKKQGITPVAVLQEFSLPAWFAAQGAWDHPKAPALFQQYVEQVHEALGNNCQHWIPLSEPLLWHRMAFAEKRYPKPSEAPKGLVPRLHGMAECYLRAWDTLRGLDSGNAVGVSITAPSFVPADPHSPWDMHAVRWQQHRCETSLPAMLRAKRGGECPFSFLAVSAPGRQSIHFSPVRPRGQFACYESAPGIPGSADTGTPDAGGLAVTLEGCAAWGTPLLVTGVGVATEEDDARCTFLLDHVASVLDCRRRGVNIMGFCYRSLLDGFEWRHGYTRRFGLVHVDWKTLARTPNPSMFLYQDIAKNDGIRDGSVARFCPGWKTPQKEAC